MATNRLQWFKDWLRMDHPYGQIDKIECELKKVKWEEETEHTHPRITEKLVWSGGAEKTITYIDWGWAHRTEYYDEDQQRILHAREPPAYTEEIERDTYTETKTRTRTAWVDGSIPDGVTETGDTKTVYKSRR